MRISDWSSDVCSSDLLGGAPVHAPRSRIIAPPSLRGSQNKERIMAPYPKAASRARAALRRRHRQLGQLVVARAQHPRHEPAPYLDVGRRIAVWRVLTPPERAGGSGFHPFVVIGAEAKPR